MCLYVSEKETEKLKRRFKNKRVILYKHLLMFEGNLHAPLQNFKYSYGWNIGRGKLDQTTWDDAATIYDGVIHVYTTKKEALYWCSTIDVVVPVVCYLDDFVAGGDKKDAVFTKVYLRKKDYKKALNAKSKYHVVGK